MTGSSSPLAIKAWMRDNAEGHVDAKTGELNCTSLTEAWDAAHGEGGATLDPLHPAWDVAVEIAGEVEERS